MTSQCWWKLKWRHKNVIAHLLSIKFKCKSTKGISKRIYILNFILIGHKRAKIHIRELNRELRRKTHTQSDRQTNTHTHTQWLNVIQSTYIWDIGSCNYGNWSWIKLILWQFCKPNESLVNCRDTCFDYHQFDFNWILKRFWY